MVKGEKNDYTTIKSAVLARDPLASLGSIEEKDGTYSHLLF